MAIGARAGFRSLHAPLLARLTAAVITSFLPMRGFL